MYIYKYVFIKHLHILNYYFIQIYNIIIKSMNKLIIKKKKMYIYIYMSINYVAMISYYRKTFK